ncbi:MAG: rhodanese-like domain-containing protein [Verrucomicrobiota bacterium JB022]|nr:rhodanese-like domain-containing protein [Verrucomicrobiota bacterium JB022]
MWKLWRDILVLVFLSLVAGGLTAFIHPRAPEYGSYRPGDGAMSAIEAQAEQRPILWIDARAEPAYLEGHIEGAIWLNEDAWDENLIAVVDAWTPDQVVIVYCDGGGCHASQAVAERLMHELGIENVYHLEGGYPAWLERVQ